MEKEPTTDPNDSNQSSGWGSLVKQTSGGDISNKLQALDKIRQDASDSFEQLTTKINQSADELSEKVERELDPGKHSLNSKLRALDKIEQEASEDFKRLTEKMNQSADNLSEKVQRELKAELAQINEDEHKDYDNHNKINHKHTREEYERFRREAFANAFANNTQSEPDSNQSPHDTTPSGLGRHEIFQQFKPELEAMEKAEYESGEKNEYEAKEKAEHEAKEKAEYESREKLERKAQEYASLLDTISQKINGEAEANDGIAIPTSPEGAPVKTNTAENPFNREALKQRAEELADLMGAISQKVNSNPEANPSDPAQDDSAETKKAQIEKDNQLRSEMLKALEDNLAEKRAYLAERYARNRRLIVSPQNRAEFVAAREEYEELLDQYLKLKAKDTYEKKQQGIDEFLKDFNENAPQELEKRLTELNNDEPTDERSDKSPEEIFAERKQRILEELNKELESEYATKQAECKTAVHDEFLQNYIDEQLALEKTTADALDTGTFPRKVVHKILANKKFKAILIAAGAAGLAVTGVGLAAGVVGGTMSVGFGLTASGAAAGAARGTLGGVLMSRQDSKNSAVHNFATKEQIEAHLNDYNIIKSNGTPETANVASWLLDQYEAAKNTDLSSNRKRTAVAAGLGATIGTILSGIHVDSLATEEVAKQVQTGNKPIEYHAEYFNNVNIPQGHGAYDTFTQMGGDPKDFQQALDIMHRVDADYGLVPGSNGETVGQGGLIGDYAHTYPGSIDTWPKVIQSYMHEVAAEWVKAGIIPGSQTGGGPIYDTVTQEAIKEVPNGFMGFLTQATATVGAGVSGSAIGGRNNQTPPPST